MERVLSSRALALFVLVLVTASRAGEAGIIRVPGDSPTIQGGINLAQRGDSVLVDPGIYLEHINLVSNVSVIGADAPTTIIDGSGQAIDVVRAISVADVLFKGFTVRAAISGGGLPGGAGVFVNFPAATVRIEDVIATENDFGVAVFNGYTRQGPDIVRCVMTGNNFYGVSNPGNGLVSECLIHNNLHGINQAGNSTRPQILDNTIWGNRSDGFRYWNDFAPTVRNNIFAENGGYGIRERAPGTFVDPIVEFNLFWQNGAGNYYDVQTGMVRNTAPEINGMPNASSNLVDDPLLCAPPVDFALCEDSPAIGAGIGGTTIGALGAGCPPCGTTTSVADEAPIAGRPMLAARPNPFAFATDIPFTVERRGHALLRVHDASGRVVRTLLDEEIGPGERLITWDGRTDGGQRAPAGIYLLSLEVDGVTVSHKVALLDGS